MRCMAPQPSGSVLGRAARVLALRLFYVFALTRCCCRELAWASAMNSYCTFSGCNRNGIASGARPTALRATLLYADELRPVDALCKLRSSEV
jgi:hypothetical protein